MAKSKPPKPKKLDESDKPANGPVETTDEVQSSEPKINFREFRELIQTEVRSQLEGLQDRISEAIKVDFGIDEIVNTVLLHIEEKKSTPDVVPKWARLNPQTCYEQCMNRALTIITNGQTQVFMQNKTNCKALMNQVIKLANSMFESLAEEFEIAS